MRYQYIAINSLIVLFLLISASLVGGAALAPILEAQMGYPHGSGIYHLLGNICHQYPTRSFWVMGHPFALCARCTGGYLGIALISIMFLFFSERMAVIQKKRFLYGLLLISPGVIDGFVQMLTSYESINSVRLVTGVMGGWGAFLLFLPLPLSWKQMKRDAVA